MSRECPDPSPWSAGMGKESSAWTRVDWVCSKTCHGPLAEFLTRTWPYADGPEYSHWSVAANRRPDWAASAMTSLSWMTGDLPSVVSGSRTADTA